MTAEELKAVAELVARMVVEALPREPKEMMTMAEAADFLGISENTMRRMCAEREITSYCPGGKIRYFKRKDLETWMMRGRTPSYRDIEDEAVTYVATHRGPELLQSRVKTNMSRVRGGAGMR